MIYGNFCGSTLIYLRSSMSVHEWRMSGECNSIAYESISLMQWQLWCVHRDTKMLFLPQKLLANKLWIEENVFSGFVHIYHRPFICVFMDVVRRSCVWKATASRQMIAKLSNIHATNDNILISHKANKCPFWAQTKVCALPPTESNMLGKIVCIVPIGLEHWVNWNVKLYNVETRTSAADDSRGCQTRENNALSKFSAESDRLRVNYAWSECRLVRAESIRRSHRLTVFVTNIAVKVSTYRAACGRQKGHQLIN